MPHITSLIVMHSMAWGRGGVATRTRCSQDENPPLGFSYSEIPYGRTDRGVPEDGFARAVYRDHRWPILRRLCLERDAYLCRIVLPGCSVRARSADHVVELEDGGAPFDLANLQAACVSCNSAKSNYSRQARARGRVESVRVW